MSYRVQHKFWLDIDRDEEATLNDQVVHLKQHRSFAATVRDGIRLICDLRAGRLDVLLELFPWIADAITDSRAGGDDGKTAQIERQLNELERLILSQDNGRMMSQVAGPKPLAVPKIAAPVPDDNDLPMLKITKSKAPASSSAAAFLSSAFAIAGQ